MTKRSILGKPQIIMRVHHTRTKQFPTRSVNNAQLAESAIPKSMQCNFNSCSFNYQGCDISALFCC